MRLITVGTRVKHIESGRIGVVTRVYPLHRMYAVTFDDGTVIRCELVDIIYYIGV